MTPEQKIKWLILAKDAEWDSRPVPDYPIPNADELFDELVESDRNWDAVVDVRASGIETKLKCESSRHYESKAVAAKLPDGSWVGWTYWYGGGKHSDPGSVEWMCDAYDVECKEEQKLVTVQTFQKLGATQ